MIREHEIQVRVRYCETDGQGALHHSHYANFFEQGRTEMLRAQGGNYREIEERGYFLVVVKLNCHYHRPARYDDLLTIRTILAKAGPAKLEHHYQILRDGELLAEGSTVLACVDREGRVQRIPEILPGLE